eukprot:ANDGO_01875.mRNA.1 hypothetical protein AMSG_10909
MFRLLNPAGDSPSARVGQCSCSSSAIGTMWVFGGWSSDAIGLRNDLYEYSVSQNRWKRIHPHVWARSGIGGVVCDPPGAYSSASFGQMPCPRSHGGLVYVDHLHALFLFGGFSSHSECLNDMYVYWIKIGKWAKLVLGTNSDGPKPPQSHASPQLTRHTSSANVMQQLMVQSESRSSSMPLPRAAFTMTMVRGFVFLFGGFVKATNGASDDLWVLDASSYKPSDWEWRLFDNASFSVHNVHITWQELLPSDISADWHTKYCTDQLSWNPQMMLSLCGHTAAVFLDAEHPEHLKPHSSSSVASSNTPRSSNVFLTEVQPAVKKPDIVVRSADKKLDTEVHDKIAVYGGLSEEGGLNHHVYVLNVVWDALVFKHTGRHSLKSYGWERIDHQFSAPSEKDAVYLKQHLVPPPRANHVCGQYGTHMVIWGGLHDPEDLDAWLFDISNLRWYRLSGSQDARMPMVVTGSDTSHSVKIVPNLSDGKRKRPIECVEGGCAMMNLHPGARCLVFGGRSLHGPQNLTFDFDCTVKKARVLQRLKAVLRFMHGGKKLAVAPSPAEGSQLSPSDAVGAPGTHSPVAGSDARKRTRGRSNSSADKRSNPRAFSASFNNENDGDQSDRSSNDASVPPSIPATSVPVEPRKLSPGRLSPTVLRRIITPDNPALVNRWLTLDATFSPESVHNELLLRRSDPASSTGTQRSVSDDGEGEWRMQIQAQRSKIMSHLRMNSIERLDKLDVLPHRFTRLQNVQKQETESLESKMYNTAKQRFSEASVLSNPFSHAVHTWSAVSAGKDGGALHRSRSAASMAGARAAHGGDGVDDEHAFVESVTAYSSFSPYEVELANDAVRVGDLVKAEIETRDINEIVTQLTELSMKNKRIDDAVRFSSEVLHPYRPLHSDAMLSRGFKNVGSISQMLGDMKKMQEVDVATFDGLGGHMEKHFLPHEMGPEGESGIRERVIENSVRREREKERHKRAVITMKESIVMQRQESERLETIRRTQRDRTKLMMQNARHTTSVYSKFRKIPPITVHVHDKQPYVSNDQDIAFNSPSPGQVVFIPTPRRRQYPLASALIAESERDDLETSAPPSGTPDIERILRKRKVQSNPSWSPSRSSSAPPTDGDHLPGWDRRRTMILNQWKRVRELSPILERHPIS